jgi:ABC-type dipeptide/oligopeptide/nickel transport system permease subunit
MLAEGRYAFRRAPWVAAAPGIAITLTVWAINKLADGLQRMLTRECS